MSKRLFIYFYQKNLRKNVREEQGGIGGVAQDNQLELTRENDKLKYFNCQHNTYIYVWKGKNAEAHHLQLRTCLATTATTSTPQWFPK